MVLLEVSEDSRSMSMECSALTTLHYYDLVFTAKH